MGTVGAAAIAGFILAIFGAYFLGDPEDNAGYWMRFVIIIAATVAITLLVQGVSAATKAASARGRATADGRRQQMELAAARARAAADAAVRTQALRDQRLAQAQALPQQIVEAYGMAADLAEYAQQWVDAAERYFMDRAFTPFWEACEAALDLLGQHSAALTRAAETVTTLSDLTDEIADDDPGREELVPRVPADVGRATALAAGESVNGRVQALAYRAQQDFQFASIFEQRRTTSAVIAGFAGVAAALRGIQTSIWAANETLTSAMSEAATRSSDRTVSAIESLDRSAGAYANSESLGGQVRQINERLEALNRR